MKLPFTIIFILLSISLHAQALYKPAVVTMLNNVKQRCFVRVSNQTGEPIKFGGSSAGYVGGVYVGDNSKQYPAYIEIKEYPAQEDIEELKLNQIKFLTVEGRYYERLILEEMDMLVPRLIEGYINLFVLSRPGLIKYYLVNDKTLIEVKKRSFKKDVAYVFRDDKALTDQIIAGELKFQDMELIVNKFNKSRTVKPTEDYYIEMEDLN